MRSLGIVISVALAACSQNDDFPAPQIASITPNQATAGTVVLVEGSDFCHQAANEDPLACLHMGSVLFGTTAANVNEYEDSSVMVEVPSGTGRVPVTLTVSGEVSNAITFQIN